MHSTDPNWRPNNDYKKLLAFFETHLMDLIKNDPTVTVEEIAKWLAAVRLGDKKKK